MVSATLISYCKRPFDYSQNLQVNSGTECGLSESAVVWRVADERLDPHFPRSGIGDVCWCDV